MTASESDFITSRWTDTDPVVSIQIPGAIKLHKTQKNTQESSVYTSGISANPPKLWTPPPPHTDSAQMSAC